MFAELEPNPATHYGVDFPYLERDLRLHPEATRPVEILLVLARDAVRVDLLAEWGLNETRESDQTLFEERAEEYSERLQRAIAAKQMFLFWDAQGGDVTSLMFRKAREWGRIYGDLRKRFAQIGIRSGGGTVNSISLGM